jgi:hypothetical protein
MEYDPSSGFYRYVPNTTQTMSSKTSKSEFTHCIHSLGFRIPGGDDRFSFKTGGLMSGGCSYTYGYGISAEDAFPAVAARELGGIPCHNFGTCGFSLVAVLDQLRALEENGILEKLRPEYYVLGVGSWLFGRSTSPFLEREPPKPLRSILLKCRSLLFGRSFSPSDYAGGLLFKFPYLTLNEKGNVTRTAPPLSEQWKLIADIYQAYSSEGDVASLTEHRRSVLESAISVSQKISREMGSFRPPEGLTAERMYLYLLPQYVEICNRNRMRLYIIHIPTPDDWIRDGRDTYQDLERVICSMNFHIIHLVDGRKTLNTSRGGDPYARFPHDTHPSAEMHRDLGMLIANAIRNAP